MSRKIGLILSALKKYITIQCVQISLAIHTQIASDISSEVSYFTLACTLHTSKLLHTQVQAVQVHSFHSTN